MTDRGFDPHASLGAGWVRGAYVADEVLEPMVCRSRSGVMRMLHSPDKDSRCVFCDCAVAQ